MSKPYLNRFAKRRDANEPEIIQIFKNWGISVVRLDQPVDLLLGYDSFNYLVEVKVEGKKLNSNQEKFKNEFKGDFWLIDSDEKANRLAELIVTGEA
jgi:hypothetical protein